VHKKSSLYEVNNSIENCSKFKELKQIILDQGKKLSKTQSEEDEEMRKKELLE
jgi:hypothetical protein